MSETEYLLELESKNTTLTRKTAALSCIAALMNAAIAAMFLFIESKYETWLAIYYSSSALFFFVSAFAVSRSDLTLARVVSMFLFIQVLADFFADLYFCNYLKPENFCRTIQVLKESCLNDFNKYFCFFIVAKMFLFGFKIFLLLNVQKLSLLLKNKKY